MAEAPTVSARILRNTGCQDLMMIGDITHCGWLRKRTKFHRKFAKFPFISKMLPWFHKYVVITRGCVYVYKTEYSTAPSEAFLLLDFQRVVRVEETELHHNVTSWAFRLEHNQDSSKLRCFSCSSEKEMQLWMIEFKKEMYVANIRQPKARTKFIQDIDKIKEQLKKVKKKENNDNDGDDDCTDLGSDLYVYIESKVPTDGNNLKRTGSATSVYNDESGISSLPMAQRSASQTLPKAPNRPKPNPKPEKLRTLPRDASAAPWYTDTMSDTSSGNGVYEDMLIEDRSLWDDALWTGAKEAGDSCIREQTKDGVYLIRYTNNGQQAVLVVHIPTNRLCKFKIIENDNFFIKIDEQFKTREDLLVHYKCHNLPGYSVKLTKSYRHV